MNYLMIFKNNTKLSNFFVWIFLEMKQVVNSKNDNGFILDRLIYTNRQVQNIFTNVENNSVSILNKHSKVVYKKSLRRQNL